MSNNNNKKDGMRETGIYARNGRLYCIIPVITYKDGKKKYISKWEKTGLTDTTRNLKKARQLRELLMERYSKDQPIHLDESVPQFVDLFLEKKKKEIAESTYRPYRDKCRHIQRHFETAKIRAIKREHVIEFLESLYISGLHPKYINDIRNLFMAVMDFAVQNGIILSNPVSDAKPDKSIVDAHTVQKREDDFLSEHEQQLFLSLSKGHPLYDLFYATLYYGFRREEALGLRWRSIDFGRGVLRVEHTVVKGNDKIIRNNTGKTASSIREFPVNEKMAVFFHRLKENEIKNRKLFGNKYISPELDYVFRHMDGSLFYPDYPSQAFHDLVKKHPELPQHIKFHSLRKTCCSNLIRAGVEPKAVQLWMGHKDISTTMKYYYRIKDEDAKKAADVALVNIFDFPKKKGI